MSTNDLLPLDWRPDVKSVSQIGKIAPSADPVAKHCSSMGALKIAPAAAWKRDQLAALYQAHGPLTDQEAADLLRWPRSSVIPRRTELMVEGRVQRVGTKRNPATGISNTTYTVS